MSDDTLEDRYTKLARVRPRLLSFARLHLRDHAAAEDAVQEALIAAIEKNDSFSGRSGYETWVFGILKYKLLDQMRQQKRQGKWEPFDEEAGDEALDQMFKRSGSWAPGAIPKAWDEPDQALENQAFWQVFDACMLSLPENVARVFSLRELMGLTTEQICQEIGIKENNAWVILHRARLKLRSCIEKGWMENAA
ncbi:sigma-70 family RNA polymerase sigma factor [Halomonas huangheensis]|uniref:sigma-70 family RNA polymerase sigma factor n=1 Tax=Halomonas huangheensis TaxID=1178482 RepID=UPI0004CFD358|nr:sigma-70 family RNA polymerase sigma factor [Halomonas huangheensis]